MSITFSVAWTDTDHRPVLEHQATVSNRDGVTLLLLLGLPAEDGQEQAGEENGEQFLGRVLHAQGLGGLAARYHAGRLGELEQLARRAVEQRRGIRWS